MAWQEGGEVGRVMSRGPLWAVWSYCRIWCLWSCFLSADSHTTQLSLLKLAIEGFGTGHRAALCLHRASLACIAFLSPFCRHLAFFTCLPEEPGKARWPQLRRQSLMPAPLKALHSFVLKLSALPIEQYWVGALWMALSDGWVRGPDLNSTAGIIQCLSGQTLSAISASWYSGFLTLDL